MQYTDFMTASSGAEATACDNMSSNAQVVGQLGSQGCHAKRTNAAPGRHFWNPCAAAGNVAKLAGQQSQLTGSAVEPGLSPVPEAAPQFDTTPSHADMRAWLVHPPCSCACRCEIPDLQ